MEKSQRDQLIEQIAEERKESIDLLDLMDFYKNHQIELLSKLSDQQLIEAQENLQDIRDNYIFM